MVHSATVALLRTFIIPNKENPTLTGIRTRHQAEQAQLQAERAAKEARELAIQAQLQADVACKRACARQIEADRAVERVTEDMKRLKDAAKIDQRAQELAKEARKSGKRDAARLARKARMERERSQKMFKDVTRELAAAKKERERMLKAAEEKHCDAEDGKALAEGVSRAAEEKVRKAIEENEGAAMRLKEGIQPIVTPSPTEVAAAKWRIQYKEDCFHFAVVGVPGRRKSSLINAFRGFRSGPAGPSAAGAKKATLQMARYPDANPKKPFVWYDVPNAGALKCRDWQYFNDQGLYVFDAIILVFDNRLTETDVAILCNARRFNIPTYIIRDNADKHIRKVMKRMRYSKKGDGEEGRNKLYEVAREEFIEKTRKSVRTNLKDAKLLDQRVYIVSKATLPNVVQNKKPKKTAMDEVDLLRDILTLAYSRRLLWG